jgi:cyclase
MTTHRLAVAGILLAAWATVAAATRGQVNQFAGVAVTTTHVAGNVYMVQRPGGGGNVGAFVGPDGVLLVDSLFAPLADRLAAAVRKITDREIRFLLNTHATRITSAATNPSALAAC